MQRINSSLQTAKKQPTRRQKARPSSEPGYEAGLDSRHIDEVLAGLKAELEVAKLWDSLDYFEISASMRKTPAVLFPRHDWLSCAPVTSGGNHYVYIGAVYNGKHRLVFVGKTSKGFAKACEIANKCALELGA